MTIPTQENRTLLDAGAAQAEIRIIHESAQPFIAIPDGYRVENLEGTLPNPLRKTGTVQLTDSASFIAYTKKHGSLDTCTVYADIEAAASRFNLVAVINDHAADEPKWRDHRCLFTPAQSVEWKRWTGSDRKTMQQTEFATWLEDNLGDVVAQEGFPSGADMLALALGFEANADKRVRSKVNLQSGGVRFEFIDDETKDTRTSMDVFQRFMLGIPVFDGSSDAYPLEARLKYREKSGTLTFWYELIRPDRVFKTAVQNDLTRIREATGFAVLSGSPE